MRNKRSQKFTVCQNQICRRNEGASSTKLVRQWSLVNEIKLQRHLTSIFGIISHGPYFLLGLITPTYL